LQRVTRLAPLSEILAYLYAKVGPVPPVDLEPRAAVGHVLASDLIAPADWPPRPVATRDGWAVESEHVLDASPFAPRSDPSARWIEIGEPVEGQADAVLRAGEITVTRSGPEVTVPATAGDGVAGAGSELAKGTVLRHMGYSLRASDAAVATSCGIRTVAVRRPRVALISTALPTFSAADIIAPVISRLIERAACTVEVIRAANLEEALCNQSVDAVIGIGGTGEGRRDATVETLARVGTLAWHGLGIAPGESTALGAVHQRPVLLLPGRLGAALAAMLMVGTAMLGRLAGQRSTEIVQQARLTRKVTSTIGIADLLLLRCVHDEAEPLAAGGLTFQALAQADGWSVVPPESEGYPAGSLVEVRALP
jgi:molybdopterin molybdotransferase